MVEEREVKGLDLGLEAIRHLSEEIGPRPPCSAEEREAADYLARELEALGLDPVIEEFASGRSFGPGYLAAFGLSLAGSVLGSRHRWAGGGLALIGLATLVAEGRFSARSPARLLRRRRSRNVFASIEPKEECERTICLMSHLDSSRSGWMFHPRVTPHLSGLVTAAGVSTALQPLYWWMVSHRRLRFAAWGSRLLVCAGLLLIIERELRGEDVPGANDNASGVGACLALGQILALSPARRSRIVLLFNGSEESGVLGARDFLQRHDTSGWFFINFDGVGADASLRVLAKEGGSLTAVAADEELMALAAEIGVDEPELLARPLDHGSGLPYDSTAVLVRGGRAISVVNQDGAIPDYHWPTDRFDRISSEAFQRAVRFGQRLAERIDRLG